MDGNASPTDSFLNKYIKGPGKKWSGAACSLESSTVIFRIPSVDDASLDNRGREVKGWVDSEMAKQRGVGKDRKGTGRAGKGIGR